MKTYITKFVILMLAPCIFLLSATAWSGEVEIVDVKAHQQQDKTWTIAVTLKHADTGWDHYANEWQVIAPNNKILATRTLYHPHVNEQPFTRNTSGVKIAESIETIRIIAKDTVHGLAKSAMQVNLKTKETTLIRLELNKK